MVKITSAFLLSNSLCHEALLNASGAAIRRQDGKKSRQTTVFVIVEQQEPVAESEQEKLE
jgi:hypothetical protein